MTTDEIKKMIADTLQGQGNQVDIGGGIPKILNAILTKIEELGISPYHIIFVSLPVPDFTNLTIEEAALRMDITVKELRDLSNGGYPVIGDADNESQYLLLKEVQENGYANIYFFKINGDDMLQAVHRLIISPDGKYTYNHEL